MRVFFMSKIPPPCHTATVPLPLGKGGESKFTGVVFAPLEVAV